MLALFILYKKNFSLQYEKYYFYSYILTTLILSFLAFNPLFIEYKKSLDIHSSNIIHNFRKQLDINYDRWNPQGDIQKNGLFMHLINTAARKPIPEATLNNQKSYQSLKSNINTSNDIPKTIIFILCESCWYDNKNFKEIYTPLFKKGFREMRGISPVYGAGTANSEFEVLTGLPSTNQVLSGIIYQEYGQLFSKNTHTLVSALKKQGYSTVAIHNFHATGWNRHIIYPKFCFDKFIALEQMNTLPEFIQNYRQPWQWQPDDYLLYNAALNELQHKKNNKIFLHLITMSTHGAYNNVQNYTYQINEAINRLNNFIIKVKTIDPNVLIVLYGDHKPALNEYFYQHNLLFKLSDHNKPIAPDNLIWKDNITQQEIGDIPILILDNSNKFNLLKHHANNLPLFCLGSWVDKIYFGGININTDYSINNICNHFKDKNVNYNKIVYQTPEWLYWGALFQ